MLQQYLPFTVLKPYKAPDENPVRLQVATVLTVYGIETNHFHIDLTLLDNVATVLTVYGIETCYSPFIIWV